MAVFPFQMEGVEDGILRMVVRQVPGRGGEGFQCNGLWYNTPTLGYIRPGEAHRPSSVTQTGPCVSQAAIGEIQRICCWQSENLSVVVIHLSLHSLASSAERS
jgi:hypothetical protein